MDCSVFITLGIYTPLEARVYAHNNCMSCPSCWATLSALLINIPAGFTSSCFLHSDQPLSGGEIIPFSGVCQSGNFIIHAGGGGGFALTDRLLMCNRRRPAATSSRGSIIFSFASACSFVYLHRAQQHHADASAFGSAVRQLQFSGIFCRAGLYR